MQMSDENTIEIQLGLTSYKDIIGTTQNHRASYWVQKGIQEYQNPRTYMSDGLGCGILVFTRDDYLLVNRRSQWTGECPDMFDRPGGHAEPEKIMNSKQINKDVTNELWFSSLDELEAEVGIHRKEVCQYDFLGLSLNSGSADRPSLEFCAKLNIDADDVNNRYRLGSQAEANESSSLVLLSKSKFQQLFTLLDNHCIDKRDLGHESKEILQMSTPALQGAIYMFGKLTE